MNKKLLSQQCGYLKSFFGSISEEILQQDLEHGYQSKPQATWFLNLIEEIGEASKELFENGETEHYYHELTQAAALIAQMIWDSKNKKNQKIRED